MFKINIYLKFALIAVFLGGGIILAFLYGLGYSILLIIIGLVLLASYLLLGTVQSASEMVQMQQFDAAEQRLNLTFRPQWLYVTNRAFYYIMKGTIAAQKQDNDSAEELFQTALSLKLPSYNEKAMVLMQLAGINAGRSKWKQAEYYYREVKKLNVTEKAIKVQLVEFDKAFSQRGQAKAAQRQGVGRRGGQMQRPGGKRRRPKMR